MLSSSVALPDALLAANMYSLGDFDGCLSVPEAVYCLLDVEVRPARQSGAPPLPTHPGDEVSPFEPPHGHNATLWDLLQTSGNRRRFRRDLQQWAHSDCTDFDAQHGRRADTFWKALHKNPSLQLGTLFILAFPVLVLVASARTAFREFGADPDAADCRPLPEKQSMLGQLMDCFAVQNTGRKLCRFQSSQIHSIQGLRTATMILIVFGHHCMYLFGGPVLNPDFLETAYTRLMRMLAVNGTGVVATFFVISGFLEARLSMMHIGKLRRFNLMVVLAHYAIRYFRLLPALAVVLAVETQWMQYMGSGPFWGQVVGRVVRDCQQYWWTHLLFVNNYVAQGSTCMIQTWFVAAILQMYLATPLLMWLVSRWTLRALWPGCCLLGLLLAAAAATYYATALQQGLLPSLHIYPQLLRRLNLADDPTFVHQYVQTHNNAVPYVVGLIVGTLFYLANRREWRPSKTMGTLMWLGIPLTLVILLASFFSMVVFYLPSFEARPLLDTAYGPARLLGFSLPAAWIIFTCGLGHGGLFDSILTWKPVVTLGRITYSVYLAHVAVILVSSGIARHPMYVSDYSLVGQSVGTVVVSYIMGTVLHFCVEAPMANVLAIVVGYWFQNSDSAALTKERGPADEVAQQAPEAPDDSEDVHEDTSRRSSTCTTNM
ncbi:nose resistant to fluoxetine protein 6-like [Thrips palmi]|uniref:Nose resistant to fluoxetine protein 6-like n=1 Tax=Thrips palmi TaxID=161013 RepID=A0A6P8YJU1_THRPL|nr:nose resistant to fluoxetine protein 6-like [Thrips palmi]